MSANKKTAVFGIYTSVAHADQATDSLVKAGFNPATISALLPENLGSRQIGTEKSTKAPEGATVGAGPERYWAVRWDCWQASARWPSRALDR